MGILDLFGIWSLGFGIFSEKRGGLVNPEEKQEVLRDWTEIQGLARKIREASGIPVLESCARWCETYSQMALWSLGAKDRFGLMEASEMAIASAVEEEPATTISHAETVVAAARSNGKTSRWGLAIDLKRCTGCQSCTLACKMENGTPPGVFWMRVLEKEEGTFPLATKTFMPLRCNHCANAPCVSVCPTSASYKRKQDNLVLIDQNKCIGCRACVVACPYQVRYVPSNGKGYYGEQMTPYEDVSYQKWQPETAQKCTFCVHRIDQGLEPACVQTCPTKALVFGDLNDQQSGISILLQGRTHFQPHSELGTDPSLYYLT